jgi:hypothetical protein
VHLRLSDQFRHDRVDGLVWAKFTPPPRCSAGEREDCVAADPQQNNHSVRVLGLMANL